MLQQVAQNEDANRHAQELEKQRWIALIQFANDCERRDRKTEKLQETAYRIHFRTVTARVFRAKSLE